MAGAPAPQFLGLDLSRSTLLVRLRDSLGPILANNLLPHFTEHGVAHSDSLVKLVSELTSPLRGTERALNPDELVVVYAACYLHDVGLQYERAYELGVIPTGEFSAPWSELSDDAKRTLLRRHHHRVSAVLVQRSASSTAPLGLQLTDEYHPSLVAALCAAHCLDTDSDEYEELTVDRPNVRMGLLIALLRVADILDESRKRALRAKAETLDLDIDSLTHWWRHYYTQSVTFDAAANSICIHFEFPTARLDEYARIIPELQLPVISEELDKHRGVFSKNGLAWHVVHETRVEQYETADAMPDNVLVEMAKQLVQRRQQLADAQRAADLCAFEEAQPLLRRQVEELEAGRETLSPADYLRKLHALARDRWQFGSKRAACMMVQFNFCRDAGHLPASERLEMAVELADWLYEDDQALGGLEVLQKAEDVAAASGSRRETRLRYWQLRARCASANYDHQGADAATQRLVEVGASDMTAVRLLAERAEWQYLRGDQAAVTGEASPGAALDVGSPAAIGALETEKRSDNLGLRVDARVRRAIAHARSIAPLQGARVAIDILESVDGQVDAHLVLDHTALRLAKAKLLFLDGRALDALSLMDSLCEGARDAGERDLEVALLDNRAVVRLAELQFEAEVGLYERHDWRTIRGMAFWNASKILGGVISAENRKHYDALPAFWRQLVHTYQGMSWQGQRWAHERMARELIQIGYLSDAAWHAIAALDKELSAQIGKAALHAKDAELVSSLVSRVLGLSGLRRYGEVGICTVKEMLDGVPDGQIVGICQLLLRSVSETAGDRSLIDRLNLAWDAVGELAYRLDDQWRGRFVQAAIDHPMWKTPNLCRPHMIKAVHRLVAYGIPTAALGATTEASLPLATTAKSDFDYIDVINLLCNLAETDAVAKQRVGAVLFPKEGLGGNVVLGQIAPLFGKRVSDPDAAAAEAARQIRLQVQRLRADEEPTRIGFITAEASGGDTKIAACLGAGEQSLAVVRRHKEQVSGPQLISLIDTIIEMVGDSDNLLDNRAALIQSLSDLIDCLDVETARRVWDVLAPIARGEFAESSVLMTSEQSQHPLSRISITATRPGQLRGVAVVAAANLARRFPDHFAQEASSLIDAALAERDGDVRQRALASARRSSQLSASVLSAVLLATQDTDAIAARVAWLVLAEYEGSIIPDELAHSIVYAGRRATQHAEPSVRAAAASAMRNLRDKLPAEQQRAQIEALLDEFARDECYSVRHQATRSG